MKILQQYIAKTILQVTALVLIAFIGLQLLIMFIAELNYIGSAHYGIGQALVFIFLDFPQQFYQLFPMAVLIGSLLGLSSLATSSELIVMRAAGVSIAKIIQAVLLAVAVMVLLITILGEVIAPYTTYYANTYKAIKLSEGQALPTLHGLWIRNHDDFIHIKEVSDKGILHGITIYKLNTSNQLLSVAYAKKAIFHKPNWQLFDVASSIFHNDRVLTSHTSVMPWPISLQPNLLRMGRREPASMILPTLWKYIHYRESNNLNANNFRLSAWQRIFQPVVIIIMMLLALPFVFGSLRNTAMGFRLMVGMILGFGFYLFNQFFGPMTLVYQLPPILAAIIPPLLFAAVGLMIAKVK